MMGGIGIALLLLALALGYIVLYLANREEKALRTLGFIVGISVMAFSAIMLLDALAGSGKFCRKMGGKGMMMVPPTTTQGEFKK